jgi:hypothetical protein
MKILNEFSFVYIRIYYLPDDTNFLTQYHLWVVTNDGLMNFS